MTTILDTPRRATNGRGGSLSGATGAAGSAPAPAAPNHLVRSDRTFEPAIDGLRAVATFMVLIAHLAQWTGALIDDQGRPGPFVSVMSGLLVAIPIFLIISGYLLYRPWADAALGTRKAPKVTHYYWHRVLRIFPIYWVFILTTLLIFNREQAGDFWRTVRLMTAQHVQNWADLRTDPGLTNWAQTWSLATEVHYYMALPVVAFVLHRALKSRFGAPLALVLLGGVVVADFTWLVATSPSSPLVPPSLWWLRGYLGFLAVGMALAIIAARTAATGRESALGRIVKRSPWGFWALAVVAYAFTNTDWAGSIDDIALSPWQAGIKYICHLSVAFGLAAPLVLARGSGPERLLSRRTVVWVGRVSCGIFLWHLVIMQVTVWYLMDSDWAQLGTGSFFVLLPFVTALSVLAGWLSYTLVEMPVLRRFRVKPQQSQKKQETQVHHYGVIKSAPATASVSGAATAPTGDAAETSSGTPEEGQRS
ncbi:acyltransferase [Streptomyces sp. NPDC000594]|uniref:acyltransferase family protein n=1 Tax=Streptomyces sp. NPDC000594 TaxID=3154261 RepID=UPI003325F99D